MIYENLHLKNLTKIFSYIMYHSTVLVMLSNSRRILEGTASWEHWFRHCKISLKTHFIVWILIKWLRILFLPRTEIPISVSSTHIGQLTTAYECSAKKSDSYWERVYRSALVTRAWTCEGPERPRPMGTAKPSLTRVWTSASEEIINYSFLLQNGCSLISRSYRDQCLDCLAARPVQVYIINTLHFRAAH